MKDFNEGKKPELKAGQDDRSNIQKPNAYNPQQKPTTQQPLPGKGQTGGVQQGGVGGINNKDKGLGGTGKVDFNKDNKTSWK
jgi:hypothetical protein